LLVDFITIPLLCLALWSGNWIGAALVSPITPQPPNLEDKGPVIVEGPFGPIEVDLGKLVKPESEASKGERLEIRPLRFGRGLVLVGGLIFAVCGYTMWLSSVGRYRLRVLGIAVLITLIQFLVNVLAQMWDAASWLRPFTIFYYYQPQQV